MLCPDSQTTLRIRETPGQGALHSQHSPPPSEHLPCPSPSCLVNKLSAHYSSAHSPPGQAPPAPLQHTKVNRVPFRVPSSCPQQRQSAELQPPPQTILTAHVTLLTPMSLLQNTPPLNRDHPLLPHPHRHFPTTLHIGLVPGTPLCTPYTQHPHIMYSSPSTDQGSQLLNIQIMYPTNLHTDRVYQGWGTSGP